MDYKSTDKEWEKIGRDDPYFGVLTDEKYRRQNVTEERIVEFFENGRDTIADILNNVRQYVDPDIIIKRALDFGCGVGRLVIPLADIAEEVTGIDVSDSMLAEARKNCEARGIDNVRLVKSDDALSSLSGMYDFICSMIVFQHISVKRGEVIFQNLMNRLSDGGVCAIHFTYAKRLKAKKFVQFLTKILPFSNSVIKLMKGGKGAPYDMQMNMYDLNRLFFMIQSSGVDTCHADYTDHEGDLGVMLYFKKSVTAERSTAPVCMA